jgi:hypothetical protein
MSMLLSPRGGGDNDAIIIVDKAPYPDKGEAGTAWVEAMGEDGEGGASLVLTMMMTPATKGGTRTRTQMPMPLL